MFRCAAVCRPAAAVERIIKPLMDQIRAELPGKSGMCVWVGGGLGMERALGGVSCFALTCLRIRDCPQDWDLSLTSVFQHIILSTHHPKNKHHARPPPRYRTLSLHSAPSPSPHPPTPCRARHAQLESQP
jgi:hypothetical protein